MVPIVPEVPEVPEVQGFQKFKVSEVLMFQYSLVSRGSRVAKLNGCKVPWFHSFHGFRDSQGFRVPEVPSFQISWVLVHINECHHAEFASYVIQF